MPELPEVETTRLGIKPFLEQVTVKSLIIRQAKLRWPVPSQLPALLSLQTCHGVRRRGKYLLLDFEAGSVLIHLGMSGSLRILPQEHLPQKHDHVDFVLLSGQVLRYHDPRKFGCILWQPLHETHKLLSQLGPEPLSDAFNTHYLAEQLGLRKSPIKNCIMNAQIVVGVGNIYACEALFRAGLHPQSPARSIDMARLDRLVMEIKAVLAEAIQQGGTTLKDFQKADGSPGYFQQTLFVYGRAGQACRRCGVSIQRISIGNRSTFFCPECQP